MRRGPGPGIQPSWHMSRARFGGGGEVVSPWGAHHRAPRASAEGVRHPRRGRLSRGSLALRTPAFAARCARPVRAVLDRQAQLRSPARNVAPGATPASNINSRIAVDNVRNVANPSHWCKEPGHNHNRALRSPTIIHGALQNLRRATQLHPPLVLAAAIAVMGTVYDHGQLLHSTASTNESDSSAARSGSVRAQPEDGRDRGC